MPPEDQLTPAETVHVDTDSFSGGGISEIDRNHARVTNYLAIIIVGLTFIVFVLHSSMIFYLAHNRPESIEVMSHVFEIWVPTFVGLLGSAVGFYFSDRRR